MANQKGLEQILDRIRSSASPTLIERYLSLVAEIDAEALKAQRTLDLAEILVASQPMQALGIAHMVHKIDRVNLRALDVMIAALKAKGRHAKAEVLRLERERIAQGERPSGPPPQRPSRAPTLRLDDAPVPAGLLGVPPRVPPAPAAAPAAAAAPVVPEFRGAGEVTGFAGLSEIDGDPGVPDASELSMLFAVGRDDTPAEPLAAEPPAAAAAIPLADLFDPPSLPYAGGSSPRLDIFDQAPVLHAPVMPMMDDGSTAVAVAPIDFDLGFPDPMSDPALAPSGAAVAHPVVLRAPAAPTEIVRPEPVAPAGVAPAAEAPPIRALHRATEARSARSRRGSADAPSDPTPRRSGGGSDGGDTRVSAVPQPAPRSFSRATELPPEIVHSPLQGVADLFDHYWRQGFVAEARDLLAQTAGAAGQEPWWLARHALLARTKDVPVERSGGTAGAMDPRLPPPPVADAATREEQCFEPLYAEVARLAQKTDPTLAEAVAARAEALRQALADGGKAKAVPPELLSAIAALDVGGEGPEGRRRRQLVWELVVGLWGFAPDAACAAALEALGLARADFGFWGLYLDALVNDGRTRKALVEVSRVLAQNPQLGWAKTAYRRLPRIWDQLGVRGFAWSEDLGVQTLRERLAVRPEPTLASLVAR